MKNQSVLSLFIMILLGVSCGEKNQEASEESIIASNIIIGQDDRRLVRGNYTPYNRTVGQIVIELENDSISLCTATAIGDQHIITAAHCFYDGTQRFKNAFFYPGRRVNLTMPFDRFPVLEIFHPNAYNPTANTLINSGYDIAIAKVGTDSSGRGLNRRVGSIGLWAINQVNNLSMKTIGYPGDKGNFHQYMEENCTASNDQLMYFTTTCDLYQGQSGSPAFFYHAATQAYYLRGIIVSDTERANIATKLTPRRKEMIDAIIENQFASFNESEGGIWSRYVLQRDLRVRIIIDNRCGRDLLVAYHLFDENNGGTRGFYPVKPGQRFEVAKTTLADYRLHVRNDQNQILLGANSPYSHSVHGNSHQFAGFRVQDWGDHVHTFCQ
jgi:V8-like Glu-specific endopeptidase